MIVFLKAMAGNRFESIMPLLHFVTAAINSFRLFVKSNQEARMGYLAFMKTPPISAR
jgi:hypothetical protein